MSERAAVVFAPLHIPFRPAEVRAWDLAALSVPVVEPLPPEPTCAPELSDTEPEPEVESAPVVDETLALARADAEERGYADGLARAAAQWASRNAQLDALLGALPSAWESFCVAQLPALTRIAATAAEKIVHAQLTLEPERVQQIVAAALAPLAHTSRVTVYVHPDDLPLVGDTGGGSGGPDVALQPDPSVERGGCRVECAHGAVDATHAGALKRLALTLAGEAEPVD